MEKETKTGNREQFGSKLGFILAVTNKSKEVFIWRIIKLADQNQRKYIL
jgi:hypothetical protein